MSKENDELNNKEKTAGEVKKYPRVVVGVFVFNDKGELFLMRQPKWNNLFTLPGGGIKFGESPEEAAKREVKEETNMDIFDIEFLCVTNHPDLTGEYEGPSSHLVALRYTARAAGDGNIELNEEATEYRWKRIEELIKDEDTENSLKELCKKYFLDHKSWEYKYKRALADYHNLLKRTAKEKQEFARFANEQLLFDILPVFDNLKMSLAHADGAAEKNGWLEGVRHVIRQFRDVLTGLGVEEIKTAGEKFDHNTMEAVGGKGEIVAREVRAGYRLHGKVIVPAKVIVADNNSGEV